MLRDKRLRRLIEAILAKWPHTRDDDQRLLCNVWRNQYIRHFGKEAYQRETIDGFLSKVAEGLLANPESIRRTRQKIQETQPLLRGDKYRARQRHQGVVKQEIRAFK